MKASCPRLEETASTMDQIRYVPQAGNQKKKGGKALQERLLQLWPRPSAAEDKGSDHPGRGAEDMLKRARGVSSRVFTASFPRGLFHQKALSGGEHERPRHGKTPKRTQGKMLRERYLLLATPCPRPRQRRGIPREPQGRYGRLPRP